MQRRRFGELAVHEWDAVSRGDAIRWVVEQGGTVLVIGQSDTGKTEFCKELLGALLAWGRPAAWIDADVGQSTLGPPSTVGMRVLHNPSEMQDEHHPTELHFVGSTSPTGYVVPLLTGLRRLLDLSRRAEPWAIVVDTTGLATGPEGLDLKRRKVELLGPRHIVGLERERELEEFFQAYRGIECLNLVRLAVAPEVRRRSRADRRQRREEQFRRYFLNARLRSFPIERVWVSGHWIGSGEPVGDHELDRLSAILSAKVFYGERTHGHLTLFARAPMDHQERQRVCEEFAVESVHVHFPEAIKDRLVALQGVRGETLALGTAYLFDPEERALAINTPWEETDAVYGVIFGGLKVDSAGRETKVP